MGNNLGEFADLAGLEGQELLTALGRRASSIKPVGPDGVAARDYIRLVHRFDPEDEITRSLAACLT
jgi:hypothetical protein